MPITINSDLGEGLGLHSFGNDPELMTLIDLANVACGFHASDPQIMDATVALAAENDVKVGAHPGLPDLVGFGRRAMTLSPDEVENLVTYQVGALVGYLKKYDLPLNHIKPHGALFGMIARDAELMAAVARVAIRYEVPVLGLANTLQKTVCDDMGVPFIGEIYVDLGFSPEGALVIERAPKPADPAAAADRVRTAMTTGAFPANDGTTPVSLEFGSVCVHSDPHNAADVVRAVRAAIDDVEKH
ncbi:5-oxoprolinase subunit PxpA [Brevibacterium samyangense]|uniref:LamB/YcsF family protein n=1 Tax=Brevibacterium samyangense TaxID=366888 RepID=A0ABN2TBJ7_9MICO